MSETELRRIGEMIAEEILYESGSLARLDDDYDPPAVRLQSVEIRRDARLFVAAFPLWMF
jgi:hypothetical protein